MTQVEIWGHPHSTYPQRGREGVKPHVCDCVQGERGSNFGDFCAYELCDDAYNSFKKQNIWKANEMKEQNKKNKNAFENK